MEDQVKHNIEITVSEIYELIAALDVHIENLRGDLQEAESYLIAVKLESQLSSLIA